MNDRVPNATKWRFDVEQGEGGWWYVTSPNRRGLLVVAPTMIDAIAGIPARLIELNAASMSGATP